jgi:hypothetical protein
MLLHAVDGQPYTPGDDIDGDGICQWCRVIDVGVRRLALVTTTRGTIQ